jgi:hypothetical protein
MKLAEHIESLCQEHEITVESHSSGGRAWKKGRRIKIRPVKSDITYFVALHEIGHILHPDAGRGLRLHKEAHAWDWAIKNSIVPVSAAVSKMIFRSLDSYRRALQGGKRMKSVPKDHLFWQLLEKHTW